MPISSINARKRFTLVKFLIVTAIGGVIGSSVFVVLSDETTKLNAHKLEYQIHRMIKNAYDASEILEKADDVKAPMNFAGCSVENMDGAWYLVCNLNELTEGREEAVEIIRSDFEKHQGSSGLIPVSDSQDTIALFLRFAAGKHKLPSHSNTEFVNILPQISPGL